jgi:hypothetical protein
MTISIRSFRITPHTALAVLCSVFALLSQFGCDSKQTGRAAPITKSEISINDYHSKCQQSSGNECDGKQIVWRAFFKSYADGELTLHNVLGDIVLKVNPSRSVSPGAVVAFRGRLDDPSKDSSEPIKIKDATLDSIESDAQTSERLRQITNMQTSYCIGRERNDRAYQRAEEDGISWTWSNESIERDAWAPEKTKISYMLRMSQPGSSASVQELLTCEFGQGHLDVSVFTPAQNDIYGRPAFKASTSSLGDWGFPHDYLVDDDVPDPTARRQPTASQQSAPTAASAGESTAILSETAPALTQQKATAMDTEADNNDTDVKFPFGTAQDGTAIVKAAFEADGISIDPKSDERYSLLSHGKIIVDDQGREVANKFITVIGGVTSGAEHHYLVAENCGSKPENCQKAFYHFLSVSSDGKLTVSGPFQPDYKPIINFSKGVITVSAGSQTATFGSDKSISIPDEMKAW